MPECSQSTDDKVLQQLQALQSQVHDLQRQIAKERESSHTDLSVKFLLAEFNELGQFWRHTDSRLESGLNLYLTASAVIISAIVFFSPRVTDIRLFVIVVVLIALSLFIVGFFLSERIVSSRIIKREYIHALNLIRRFFVDRDAGITPYLFLPFADSPVDTPRSHAEALASLVPAQGGFFFVINVWNGLLLGFSTSACVWLIVPSLPMIVFVAAGILVAAVCAVLLNIAARGLARRRVDSIRRRHKITAC
jgi:hypothetical protein